MTQIWPSANFYRWKRYRESDDRKNHETTSKPEGQAGCRDREGGERRRVGKAKTEKEELEAELQSLSQALFEEANNMAATECKLRAETESKLQRQQQDLEDVVTWMEVLLTLTLFYIGIQSEAPPEPSLTNPHPNNNSESHPEETHRGHRDLGRGRQDIQDTQSSQDIRGRIRGGTEGDPSHGDVSQVKGSPRPYCSLRISISTKTRKANSETDQDRLAPGITTTKQSHFTLACTLDAPDQLSSSRWLGASSP
ncbi:hypothetical protein C8J55DRAFT_487178 [Lentinula edodes]|uniref:GDP/GTP exchange factor Sec2 N-terminal domain-containing protein n=1 Tax=Lentinula lateritia TaxID=40482 RepID=A0A9W9ARL8_9AGAR|nr:hypothetical protein C8J55DRAFT_487178 [Lentinula edodes]